MVHYFHMIGYLQGEIILSNDKFVILDVNGVGYKVFCETSRFNVNKDLQAGTSPNTNRISFFIHTVVREDALELFGFTDESSLALFEKLIGISGIGPRSALLIVNKGSVETLTEAINKGDLGYLTAVSGIGKKTAEKIILELRGALSDLTYSDKNEEVIMALKSLGYSERDSQAAVKNIPDGTTQERIKKALKYLGK